MHILGGFKVKWYHDNQQITNSCIKNSKLGMFTRREELAPKNSVTTCHICDDEEQILSIGTAVCKVGDNFNKREGRKRSLRRALSSDFHRSLRKMIWDDFFELWPNKG